MSDTIAEQVQEALNSSRFEQIAGILDKAELESGNPDVLSDWPHALHLFGHIYNGDLEDARFLWKRLPPEAKADNPELQAAFRLLQYLWNRHYQGTWQALEGQQWSPQLRPLVTALAETMRGRMLELLARAYSQVSAGQAALLLGVSEQEAVQLASAAGWELHESAGMLRTRRPAASAPAEEGAGGYATLHQLAEYVVEVCEQ